MRVQKRSLWLNGLGVVLAAMALWGTQAQAQVSSDKPGSVVMWPKVIADGTRDTIITLTNTRNEQAYAHCNYVQGIGICSASGAYCSNPSAPGSPGSCPGGAADVCQQTWQAADFDVVLTRQQPTIWRVSTGRQDNPFLPADGRCDLIDNPPNVADSQSCPGLFLIGNVPTSGVPFRGSLTCVQVGMDGSLLGADGLKGEATIETLGSTQISTYNSYNFEAVGNVGVEPGLVRLNGVEYAACPEALEASYYAQGAQDLVAANIDPAVCDPTDGCPVQTQITLMPCRSDYLALNQGPVWATQILTYNEFEQFTGSVSDTLECWVNFDLRDLAFPPAANSGTTFQRAIISSSGDGRCIVGNVNAPCDEDSDCGAGGVCGPVTGLLGVVEEFHDTAASLADPPAGLPGTAASNMYLVDVDGDGSLQRPGRCRGDLSEECTDNSDCPTGLCRLGGGSCTTDSDCTGDDNFCDRCMNDELLNLGAGGICVNGNCPP
jgi:hypothetical protein